jgi:TetR/AcrR family fatty acid metabolism transcriptional regulator
MARTVDPQKRADILAAARTVFAEQGFVGARIADIATRAGVATGTVYLYFESKEALVAALVDDLLTRLTIELCAVLDRPTTVAPVDETIRAALRFLLNERDLLSLQRLDLGLKGLAPYRPLPGYRQLWQELATRLAARMARGQIRRYDPLTLAAMLIGTVEWVAEIGLLRGDGDVAKYEATVLQVMNQALLPPGVGGVDELVADAVGHQESGIGRR